MHIAHSISEIPPLAAPIALTIGNFDGVHMGHRFLIDQLRRLVSPNGSTALITFSNHPSDILPFLPKTPQLFPIKHKLELLEEAGIDLVLLFPFTEALANTPYDEFLLRLHSQLPFSYLVLGEGASFGKKGAGTQEKIEKIAPSIGFHPLYLKKKAINNERVSSGLIRSCLEKGDLESVQRLLGRPYSLKAKCENGFLLLPDLCLPPRGSYPLVIKGESSLPGEAHIDGRVRIECQADLSGKVVEAIFSKTR